MAILIDADVLLQAQRGLFNLEAWLDSLANEQFKLASITVAELWHGAESAPGARLAKRQGFLQQIAAHFEVVPYTSQTAFEHARIWAEVDKGTQMISSNDLILAATAIQTGNSIATFSNRRFAAVKRLNLIQPV